MTPELIQEIVTIVLIPLAGILLKYLAAYLAAKSAELKEKTSNERARKYIDMVTDTITNCVVATNQTYVNALKEQGKFDEEAQKVAFQKTLQAVLTILSTDAKNYIQEVFGDIDTYLNQLIEAEVAIQKTR